MGPGQAAGNDLSTGEVSELPKNFMLNQMIAQGEEAGGRETR
jgi:hypothetical protein